MCVTIMFPYERALYKSRIILFDQTKIQKTTAVQIDSNIFNSKILIVFEILIRVLCPPSPARVLLKTLIPFFGQIKTQKPTAVQSEPKILNLTILTVSKILIRVLSPPRNSSTTKLYATFR